MKRSELHPFQLNPPWQAASPSRRGQKAAVYFSFGIFFFVLIRSLSPSSYSSQLAKGKFFLYMFGSSKSTQKLSGDYK